MIKSTIILSLMILASCIRSESSGTGKIDKPKDTVRSELVNSTTMISIKKGDNKTDTIVLTAKIDSIEMLCLFFGKYSDHSFRIFLSNSKLQIISANNVKDTIYVGYGKNKSKIIEYVNQFYIDKEKKIILRRTKRGYLESTDYPYIKVIGYQNKKEVFNVTTQIGEEEYDVEYHPKFLEFYEFLDSLVKDE